MAELARKLADVMSRAAIGATRLSFNEAMHHRGCIQATTRSSIGGEKNVGGRLLLAPDRGSDDYRYGDEQRTDHDA